METTSFRDFLEIREKEIREQRSQLLIELREIKTARLAIQGDNATDEHGVEKPKKTIKEMIIETLNEHPDGGSADQIIGWIQQKFGAEIVRSSLSPQLSRLKVDRQVVMDAETGCWRRRLQLPPTEQTATSQKDGVTIGEILAPKLT